MQSWVKGSEEDGIEAALPSWVPRAGLTIPENRTTQYRIRWNCPCHGRVKTDYIRPAAGATHEQMVQRLVQKVIAEHGICCQHEAADPTPPEEAAAATIAALQQDKDRLKAKKRQLDSEVEVLNAKIRKAAAATAAQKELKRQTARADGRRLDFDPEITDQFDDADKSTAMLSKCSGLVDTLKYWCQGSEEKLLQLVLAQIRHFKLEQLVADELDARQSTRDARRHRTNENIVSRARAAIQELKRCQSESQRREYRIVLTALAPELVRRGDTRGMGSRVAAALGLSQGNKVFKGCINSLFVIHNILLSFITIVIHYFNGIQLLFIILMAFNCYSLF